MITEATQLVFGHPLVLAAAVGKTFLLGEGGYGFGLVFAPLGAVTFGVLAFVVALRKLNYPRD